MGTDFCSCIFYFSFLPVLAAQGRGKQSGGDLPSRERESRKAGRGIPFLCEGCWVCPLPVCRNIHPVKHRVLTLKPWTNAWYERHPSRIIGVLSHSKLGFVPLCEIAYLWLCVCVCVYLWLCVCVCVCAATKNIPFSMCVRSYLH